MPIRWVTPLRDVAMRSKLIAVMCLVVVVPSAAAGQDLATRCFGLEFGDPFWRASETVPEPPSAPPSVDSVRRGDMTRLKLVGDGSMDTMSDDVLINLDAQTPFGSATWVIDEGELRVSWGPAWYDRTQGAFRRDVDGVWHGDLMRQTDVRVLPDPGEWRYAATLTEAVCPSVGAGLPN